MSRLRAAVLVLAATVVAPRLDAQVVARQGDPRSLTEEFTSPMVLELPLDAVGRLPFGGAYDFRGLQKYVCDDVSIVALRLVKERGSRKTGTVRYELTGTISVRPSFDRLASLELDLLDGATKLAGTRIVKVDAEEGKRRPFSARIELEPEELAGLFDGDGAPVLRITMTVVDNS